METRIFVPRALRALEGVGSIDVSPGSEFLSIVGRQPNRLVQTPGANAWSYIGVPYPTDNVPSAIMPTLPTGADAAGWPYDPCTIVKPVVGDIPDWDNAPNAYYVAYNGNDATAGNGARGNPTNARLSLPAGPFTAGAIIFIEGAGVARPTSAVSGGRNFHEVLGWQSIAITFNSAGTYASTNDICWVVGINDPRVAAFDGSILNSNHFIVDGVIFTHATESRAGRISQTNNNYFCFRHGAQYGAGDGNNNNTGGQAFGMTNCEYHVYYNQELAYIGAWLVQGDPDFHGWRPTWGNRWLWCIDSHLHHLKGDSTQVGNSNNTQTADRNSHYVYFAGNDSHDNQENAVDCKNSSHVIVSQNHFHDFTGAGFGGANSTAVILSQDGEGPHSNHHWAIGNLIEDSGSGIRCSGDNGDGNSAGSGEPTIMDRDRVIGNLIIDCTGSAISVSHGSGNSRSGQQVHVVNNTIARCVNGMSINLFQPGSTSDTYIHGNIFYEMSGGEVIVPGTNGINVYSVTDNVLFVTGGGEIITTAPGGKPTPETGNILGTDPLLVNPGVNDFRINSASSVAYNITTEHAVYQEFQDLYGINIKKDYDAVTRPQGAGWDAGAFERV